MHSKLPSDLTATLKVHLKNLRTRGENMDRSNSVALFKKLHLARCGDECPALQRQRRVDICEFKARMAYINSFRPARAIERDPVTGVRGGKKGF